MHLAWIVIIHSPLAASQEATVQETTRTELQYSKSLILNHSFSILLEIMQYTVSEL